MGRLFATKKVPEIPGLSFSPGYASLVQMDAYGETWQQPIQACSLVGWVRTHARNPTFCAVRCPHLTVAQPLLCSPLQ